MAHVTDKHCGIKSQKMRAHPKKTLQRKTDLLFYYVDIQTMIKKANPNDTHNKFPFFFLFLRREQDRHIILTNTS